VYSGWWTCEHLGLCAWCYLSGRIVGFSCVQSFICIWRHLKFINMKKNIQDCNHHVFKFINIVIVRMGYDCRKVLVKWVSDYLHNCITTVRIFSIFHNFSVLGSIWTLMLFEIECRLCVNMTSVVEDSVYSRRV
jgi:hypothetical protein